MSDANFTVINGERGGLVKAWKNGVPFDDATVAQLKETAGLPFVYKWVAAMPDAHLGIGATIGTVLPTFGAVVPAAVGVDIGCGMLAARTVIRKESWASDLPSLRADIERVVPCGRTNNGAAGDRGAWGSPPSDIKTTWDEKFASDYEALCQRHPGMRARNTVNHLGTLGTGNHFLELAWDDSDDPRLWVVLHSGSRGMGNRIGTYFTEVAEKLCARWFISLPNKQLAYLPQSTDEFGDYWKAVRLAQAFALENREQMLNAVLNVLGHGTSEVIRCHHNYVQMENHFGKDVIVTRKGAVRAGKDEMGIIPGSMGARTYIVRGLGNPDSFCSCSHGAGRQMSRTEAVRRFSVRDHEAATQGVECLKDASVLDETPGAYKDIDAVMAAQSDLVEPVYRLKQFLCVKGATETRRR